MKKEPTQYSMTMFIAEEKINKMMKNFDLKPNYKWYVSPQAVIFSTTTTVDRDYLMRLIKKSKKFDGFWIPAIKFCGKVYADKDIKILSDGKVEMFLTESK